MSSILKALKKIDETSPAADDGHPWPHPGDARDAITTSIKRRWFIRRVTTYVLVAACIISLALLLYFRQVDETPRQHSAAAGKTSQNKQTQVHRVKIGQANPAGKETKTTTQNPASKPIASTGDKEPSLGAKAAAPVRQAPAAQPAKGSRDSRKPTRSRTPLPKKSKKAATKIVPPTSQKTALKPSPKPEATKATTVSRTRQTPQYSRLQNTDMVLQAIAWAPEPAKRIAVINGSIVREGEAIEGFTLMRIRKDDIVLNDGSQTWQLDFGFKP